MRGRFEFYRDGSFRVVGINIGRGCGDRGNISPCDEDRPI